MSFLIPCCTYTHLSSFCHVIGYQDAAGEIALELQGYPDFIIGNYSDGNLVASLLAHKMGITQVCRCFWI